MFINVKQQFEEEIAEMKEKGTYKEEGVLGGKQGAEISVGGKTLLNFCANNYLGLAASDELAASATDAMKTYGFGMASVRFICGTSVIHKDLEKEIASFLGVDDALLYTSCFDANTGLFETILQEGDAVFSDELNHASIIDGIRLCKAERFRYKHNDMADLEEKLKVAGSRRRKLIATDGVFSMDGDTAKIAALADIAERYEAMIMVDDSHATGVIGARGRGSIEGYADRVDIITSTFGKALGGAGGGFVAGREGIVSYLRQKSRTSLFSNSLPPAIAGAALYVLKNFDARFQSPRATLMENTMYFRSAMAGVGFTLGGDGTHPITPVMLQDEKIATDMAAALFQKGIYVRGFTYPVVPMGRARIRVQLSAAHAKDQMDRAIKAFTEVGRMFSIL